MGNVTQVHYTPGAQVTIKAGADLTAGTLVKVSAEWGDRRNPVVVPATAGSEVLGFVREDAAKDEFVAVHRGKYIADMVADGAIAAGDPVMIGAAGKVKKQADAAPIVGVAVAAAKNNLVAVAMA